MSKYIVGFLVIIFVLGAFLIFNMKKTNINDTSLSSTEPEKTLTTEKTEGKDETLNETVSVLALENKDDAVLKPSENHETSTMDKKQALSNAVAYLNQNYGFSKNDYPIYSAKIKQYDTGQRYGAQEFENQVPDEELTYFKVSIEARFLAILPGENLYKTFYFLMNSKGEILSVLPSATDKTGKTTTPIIMQLTEEKTKIKNEIDNILSDYALGQEGVDGIMLENILYVVVTDNEYIIRTAGIQYKYDREADELYEWFDPTPELEVFLETYDLSGDDFSENQDYKFYFVPEKDEMYFSSIEKTMTLSTTTKVESIADYLQKNNLD